MERINNIMDVMIKAITLLTFFIVFLSFISYYYILSSYDLISVMIDNGFDYIKILPVIIPSLLGIFCFIFLIESLTFLLSSLSEDTNLPEFDNESIKYSKAYIYGVIGVFFSSGFIFYCFVYFSDSNYLNFILLVSVSVFSVFFGFWYYVESNKRIGINIKYKNNISGALIIFSSTWCICVLLVCFSFIIFALIGINAIELIEVYYFVTFFSIGVLILISYFINLNMLSKCKNDVGGYFLLFFSYKSFVYLFFVFLVGFLLTNTLEVINQKSYIKSGYVIMNSYKYNFDDKIPDRFLNHSIKVEGKQNEEINYELEGLNMYPHLACVFFKRCNDDMLDNNIGVIQELIATLERKNSLVSVVGVFKVNDKILICPNKLATDIQNERGISFRLYFNDKKIQYKKECLFVNTKELIN